MLKFAVNFDHPIAVRYPRGEAYAELKEFRSSIEYGKSELLWQEHEIALLAVGSMVKTAKEVRRLLKSMGYFCSLVNVRFIKPMDTDLLDQLAESHDLLVTLEENVISGGYGEHVSRYFSEKKPEHMPQLMNIALADKYVEQGNVEILKKQHGLDVESMIKRIVTGYVRKQEG